MGPAGLHEVLSSLYSKVISTKGGMDDVTWMVVSGLRWTEEGCKWSLIRVFFLPCLVLSSTSSCVRQLALVTVHEATSKPLYLVYFLASKVPAWKKYKLQPDVVVSTEQYRVRTHKETTRAGPH